MQIVYPTTPANYFHVLRRQQHRDFRKPLVVFFSKNLLRHPLAKSDLSEFTGDSVFQRYLPEHAPESLDAPEKIRRVVMCSGQVWTQLVTEREKRGLKDVAIVRLEQVSPMPLLNITEDLDKYPNADIMWAQEEPLNNGCWTYVQPRIELALEHTKNHKGKRVGYAGRGPSASVATGSKVAHKREVEAIATDAFAA